MDCKELVLRTVVNYDMSDERDRRACLSELLMRLAAISDEEERESALDAVVIEMRPYLMTPIKKTVAH